MKAILIALLATLSLTGILFLVGVWVGFFNSLEKIESVPIQLPVKADADEHASRPDIAIVIEDDGVIVVNGRQTEIHELKAVLSPKSGKRVGSVLIQGPRGAGYERTVAVLDVVRDAGIERVSIETIVKQPEDIWVSEEPERKAAEPGATDNPDDAQRLRQDH